MKDWGGYFFTLTCCGFFDALDQEGNRIRNICSQSCQSSFCWGAPWASCPPSLAAPRDTPVLSLSQRGLKGCSWPFHSDFQVHSWFSIALISSPLLHFSGIPSYTICLIVKLSSSISDLVSQLIAAFSSFWDDFMEMVYEKDGQCIGVGRRELSSVMSRVQK